MQSEIESHGQITMDPITNAVIDKNQIIKIENKEIVVQRDQAIDYVCVILEIIEEILTDQNEEKLYEDAITIFRKIVNHISGK